MNVAHGVDGVVLINQAKALAGNVTPGDAPGFPVTLSRRGSYRLSGNLRVARDTNGLEVAAEDITIDLNGFTIRGPRRNRCRRRCFATHRQPGVCSSHRY